jgi:hypothetical protein
MRTRNYEGEILEELKKLNENITRLMCFQMLKAKEEANAADDTGRPAAGNAVEVQAGVSGAHVPQGGTNGLSGKAHVRR